MKPAGPYLLRWVGRRQVREGGQVPVVHDDSVSTTDLPFIPRRSARRYRARLEGAGVGPPVLGAEELSPEKDSFDLGFLTTVSPVMREGGDEGTWPRETPHRELGFNVGCLQVGDEQKVEGEKSEAHHTTPQHCKPFMLTTNHHYVNTPALAVICVNAASSSPPPQYCQSVVLVQHHHLNRPNTAGQLCLRILLISVSSHPGLWVNRKIKLVQWPVVQELVKLHSDLDMTTVVATSLLPRQLGLLLLLFFPLKHKSDN